MHHRTLAPGARTAHLPVDVAARGPKLADATVDGTPRQTGRLGGCGHAAKALGQSFIGGKQAPPPLVEKPGGQLPTRPDVINVNHRLRLAAWHRVAASIFAILFLRSYGRRDSIISPRVLKQTVPWGAAPLAHVWRYWEKWQRVESAMDAATVTLVGPLFLLQVSQRPAQTLRPIQAVRFGNEHHYLRPTFYDRFQRCSAAWLPLLRAWMMLRYSNYQSQSVQVTSAMLKGH
ncbi:hypothetical protein [Rhodopila sp.]|uniref:hypothetical protein n=1 Tax=Rhodopila sp. TaxID=2480087 RepID=UPI003D10B24D